LFGTGKIGRNTCENLVKHTKNEQITLINRTKGKAEKLAGKLNLIVDYSELHINYKSRCCNSGHRRSKSYCRQSNFESEKAFVDLDLSIPKM
jgi:glutamyl-tRNA reductase